MNIRSEKRFPSIRLFFAVLLIFSASPTAHGQDNASAAASRLIDSQTADAGNEVARLLQSGENKDRAWAAYLIGKHKLRDYVPTLIELIVPYSSGTSSDTYLVNRVVLDSLIQLDVAIPADKFMPLVNEFAEEVVILLAKSPKENREDLLFLAQSLKCGACWTAVCNLLAETRAPGFAAYLLKDLKVSISVYVTDEDGMGGGMGVGSCHGLMGCGGSGYPPLGFPPMYYYRLTDRASRGAVVVAAGKRTIYYQRDEGA